MLNMELSSCLLYLSASRFAGKEQLNLKQSEEVHVSNMLPLFLPQLDDPLAFSSVLLYLRGDTTGPFLTRCWAFQNHTCCAVPGRLPAFFLPKALASSDTSCQSLLFILSSEILAAYLLTGGLSPFKPALIL